MTSDKHEVMLVVLYYRVDMETALNKLVPQVTYRIHF